MNFLRFAILTLSSAVSALAVTINFFPVSAPIETTAVSLWRTNAINALKNGVTTWGTPGLPGYFDASDPAILASEIVSTPMFASWDGYADPGSVFGPSFSGQLGNSYRVPFIVMRGESQFSLSQVTGTVALAGSITDFSTIPGLAGNYLSSVIGINYGGDGVFGGGDDTYIANGANTQLVDALIYNAFAHTFTVVPFGTSEQDRLNNTADLLADLTVTHTLFLDGVQIGQHEQAFQPVAAVPESQNNALVLGIVVVAFAIIGRTTRRTPQDDKG